MNNPHAELWGGALEKLQREIGAESVDLWLHPVEAFKLENHILTLKVPNKFFLNGIRDGYQKRLEAILKDLAGEPILIDYQISQSLASLPTAADPIPTPTPQSDFASTEFNPRYTFESFVVGDSNRLAHATAEAIAKKPGTQYNPFFLYGGVGLGKTHLLHAIGNHIRRSSPRAGLLYTTAEQFVNDYINAIRLGTTDAFRSKYRSLDCLLIDDIQFLISKEKSEEEFFHTFNALHGARRQVVIASDRSPQDMSQIEKRLLSRLEWGVVADIKSPDLETRIAILRKKADVERFYVPDDVLVYVASSIKNSIRTLEGALIRLKAFTSMTGSALTVDEAKEILKDSVSPEDLGPVRVDTIQRMVAQKYSIDAKDLKGQKRTSSVSMPRQLAMYLACEMTELSLKEIGEFFGGRDHSTVLHARDKIKEKLSDPFFLELVNRLQSDIRTAVETG